MLPACTKSHASFQKMRLGAEPPCRPPEGPGKGGKREGKGRDRGEGNLWEEKGTGIGGEWDGEREREGLIICLPGCPSLKNRAPPLSVGW
jgi:hypothetical protein